MTISVAIPNAWDAFNAEVQKQSATRNDQCWDVVGEPLNKPIKETVPEFYRKLELGDERVAMTKRGEILDLYWGRIEQDGAALKGLGKALENLSTTIGKNVTAVEAHWSGESYEAFKTAMGKIQTTLDAYSSAATKVGDVLLAAMAEIRSMYENYATATLDMLTFDWISPPGEWHKLDDKAAGRFAMLCPSGPFGCEKADGQAVAILKGKFVTDRLMDITTADPCENNLERVLIMYGNLVENGMTGREKIRTRVNTWRDDTTEQLKKDVEAALKIAVDNVYTLAKSNAFSSLRVLGGGGQPAGGGGDVANGGYPGGSGGGYPVSGGGYPVGGGPSAEPIVDPATATEPAPEPTPEPAPEPVKTDADPTATDPTMTDPTATDPTATDPTATDPTATDPTATDPAAQTPDPATVTITDGDRTIGVSNPGVEGHVKVTVAGADGATKTYDLDFDAASGLTPSHAAAPAPEEGVEQVAARSDGKCVIKDGDVTITAERPLFAPDQITLTVDDGTGSPTTYTVDFPDEQPEDAPADTADQADAEAAGATPKAPSAGAGAPATSASAPTVEAEPEPETAEAASDPASAEKPEQTAGPEQPTATSTADVKTNGAVPDAQPDGATRPQSWMEDAKGSVSGVLVPDQPVGEAGLAKAADAEEPQPDTAAGMAGAGVPMMGGGPANTGGEPGRAGSGWSVHGDLFDSGEPVYSMHGVLGDDDTERADG